MTTLSLRPSIFQDFGGGGSGGGGRGGVGLGVQGGCERRSKVFVRIQKKILKGEVRVGGGSGGGGGGGGKGGGGGGGGGVRSGVGVGEVG